MFGLSAFSHGVLRWVPLLFSLMAFFFVVPCQAHYTGEHAEEAKEAKESKIIFGSPIKEDSHIYSALKQIYVEAFGEMGIPFDTLPCVPKNCANLVSKGILQGETARHKEYSTHYRHMTRLDVVVFELTTVAVTRDSLVFIDSMKSLAESGLRIGYQSGYRGYEEKLKALVGRENLFPVVHWQDGVARVSNGELDVYLAVEQIVYPDFNAMKPDIGPVKVHDIKDYVIPIYPFVGEKMAPYNDALVAELLKMKKSGRLKAIFSEHGIPLR